MGQHWGEILVFEIGGRRYGLPASDIRELVRAVAIVPLPMAPPQIEGVINFRGQAIHVHDLRARLGLPDRPLEPSDQLIITRSAGTPIAIRIDRAIDLLRPDAVDLDDTTGAGSPRAGVLGVARISGKLAPILDLSALIVVEGAETRVEGETPAPRE